MRKISILLLVAIIASFQGIAQTIWSENFESTADSSLPAGWSQTSTMTNAWKTGVNTFLQSTDFPITAHTKMVAVNDDKAGSAANNSNDLLVTNTINLATATSPYLSFDLYYFGLTYQGNTESLKVEVSTNGGSSWTVLSTLTGNTSGWETRFISLAAYVGQANVKIGFRYSDGNGWLYGAALDNITVFTPAANDGGLIAMTPVAGPKGYAVTGSGVTLGGTIFNYGSTPITSFTVNYQQGAGPAVSDVKTGLNIAPFTSYSFTHATPFVPSSVTNYPLSMWVTVTGDNNHTNDSNGTSILGVAFKPTKKILVEEGTGTWCGWCPRGTVFMDSLWKTYAGNFSLVAVHNADPMVVSAYDTWMGNQIGGYPEVVVDRRETTDPSDLVTIYNNQKDYFGYGSLTLGSLSVTGSTLSLPVTFKPATNLAGDYRLVLVLTEDKVHGTTSGYNQANYYSSSSQNQPLVGAGRNWQTSPNPVPAAQMYYDFVARSISPSVTGAANLPTAMAYNQNYPYTFSNITIDPSWNVNNLRAVVLLIQGSNGQVLNSNNKMTPVGVDDIVAGITGVAVYPNPANTFANVSFTIDQPSNVQVQLIDGMGRIVNTVNEKMSSGQHNVVLPTSAIAAGIYNVKVTTEKGSHTERLSVIK
jgi:hypothetical protein